LFAVVLVLTVVLVGAKFVGLAQSRSPKSGAGRGATSPNADLMKSMAATPLYFEKNEGQTDSSVKYLSHSGQTSIFITGDSTVISMVGGWVQQGPSLVTVTLPVREPASLTQSAVRIRLMGAKANPGGTGIEPLPGRVNYLIGEDAAKYQRNVHTYGRVEVEDIYPGINVVHYGASNSFESDLIVSPKADASRIKFAIEGPADTVADAEGNLRMTLAAGTVVLGRPHVYQQLSDGSRTVIAASFALSNKRTVEEGVPRQEVAIRLAEYDHTRKLVIDPPIL